MKLKEIPHRHFFKIDGLRPLKKGGLTTGERRDGYIGNGETFVRCYFYESQETRGFAWIGSDTEVEHIGEHLFN